MGAQWDLHSQDTINQEIAFDQQFNALFNLIKFIDETFMIREGARKKDCAIAERITMNAQTKNQLPQIKSN